MSGFSRLPYLRLEWYSKSLDRWFFRSRLFERESRIVEGSPVWKQYRTYFRLPTVMLIKFVERGIDGGIFVANVIAQPFPFDGKGVTLNWFECDSRRTIYQTTAPSKSQKTCQKANNKTFADVRRDTSWISYSSGFQTLWLNDWSLILILSV